MMHWTNKAPLDTEVPLSGVSRHQPSTDQQEKPKQTLEPHIKYMEMVSAFKPVPPQALLLLERWEKIWATGPNGPPANHLECQCGASLGADGEEEDIYISWLALGSPWRYPLVPWNPSGCSIAPIPAWSPSSYRKPCIFLPIPALLSQVLPFFWSVTWS